ncbi:hypothetical protein SPOG_00675 [Schizosaccharomyces cryophilus OY26]|uniref:Uncharacterized protein n=1 Tax=Schizosaccharomyces cryophilus (strain OY26 / ATCC MYA-4695 / CBS 11777 / NBRC 106824 / NRRL Y48691) TaxID=653667 RepID=S9X132_SCHCR|nr:uncharacterized protein SPOG_00675 [Schizosaccharomyces cryophilus OY26]EPY50787.1 hypothetical protein SPOG_00675 [Schizosaccharomyces cryophilus OY26]
MNPFFGGRSSALMLALTLGVCSSFGLLTIRIRREYQNSRDLTLENEKKEENMRN